MDTANNNNQQNLVIKRQVQVEAISKAVYLVTDFFEETEPLKMSLRRVAVECVESADRKNNFLKLISLIKLAKDINLVNAMNAELLLKVLNEQVAEMDTKTNVSEVNISSVFEKEEEVQKPQNEVMVIEHKEHISVVPNHKLDKKLSNITINNNTQNIKTINNISMDIGSRRKRILEIVRSRGAVTINEFIDAIKGCSSKTIQRELTSLVLSGTLKKTGERRWSKYSLK